MIVFTELNVDERPWDSWYHRRPCRRPHLNDGKLDRNVAVLGLLSVFFNDGQVGFISERGLDAA